MYKLQYCEYQFQAYLSSPPLLWVFVRHSWGLLRETNSPQGVYVKQVQMQPQNEK